MGKIALVKTCPICRTEFDPVKSPGGMCPRCLMTGGTAEESPAPAGLPLGREGYDLIERIGRGGMGTVYRAWQSSLGRTVAVKVLSGPEGSSDAQERFENEARVLGLLEHPNIIPIHDLGRDAEGQAYYSMKLVKGRTLEQIVDDLRRGDPLAAGRHALAELLTVFEKVCDAVAFAHSQGVLHRDLKPENIMVGEFGEVLVLDWGLAKIRSEPSGGDGDGIEPRREGAGLGLTLAGDVIGTPQYMSPEQAAGEADSLDERSDVFSLGGVLYALLTLHPPVEGGDPASVMRRVRSGLVTPPSTRDFKRIGERSSSADSEGDLATCDRSRFPHCPGGRVPPALSAVAMKAMQVEKERRYPSVADLQADVSAYLRGFATSAEEATPLRQLQLLMMRHKVPTLALATVFVLSVGFVVKLMHSERQARASAEKAEAAQLVERDALAKAQVSLAEAAYRAHNSPGMLEALDTVPEDLRDVNWHYLKLRADNATSHLERAQNGSLMAAAPHPLRPGIFAAIPSAVGDIALIDVVSGERVGGFPATEDQQRLRWDCHPLAFSPDGNLIISGRPGNTVVYEVATGKPLGEGAWPSGNVIGAQFSPDGDRVCIVRDSSVVSVHEATTGKLLWEQRQAGRALWLRSGKIVIAFGGALRLVDGNTGEKIRDLFRLGVRLHSVAASPDESVLYAGCDDGWVRAFRMDGSRMVYERPVTDSSLRVNVALSGDGQRLLAAVAMEGGGQAVRMLDAVTGDTRQILMGGVGPIYGVGMHPLSGDVFISARKSSAWAGSSFMTIERSFFANHVSSAFWGRPDHFLSLRQSLRLRPDGSQQPSPLPLPPVQNEALWCADASGDLAVVAIGKPGDLTTPSTLHFIRRRGESFESAGFTAETTERAARVRIDPTGTRVMTSNGNRWIEIFNTANGQRVVACDTQDTKIDPAVIWVGPDLLAGVDFEGWHDLFVWDAATGAVVCRAKHPTRMKALAGSPDGLTLAEGGEDRKVRLRDARTLEVLREFRAHDASISALAFHPSLPLLASASYDRSVRLWDLTNGAIVAEIEPSHEAVVHLAFSPDGRVLACADFAHFTHFVRLPAGR